VGNRRRPLGVRLGPQDDEQSIAAIQHALSPMGSGLLTGAMTRQRIAGLPDDDWRKHDHRFSEPELSLSDEDITTIEGEH
jgi:hypothetical protein